MSNMELSLQEKTKKKKKHKKHSKKKKKKAASSSPDSPWKAKSGFPYKESAMSEEISTVKIMTYLLKCMTFVVSRIIPGLFSSHSDAAVWKGYKSSLLLEHLSSFSSIA